MEIERILPRPLKEGKIYLAIAGVAPIELVTLEEYKRLYPQDPELRNVEGIVTTRTEPKP